MTGLRLYRRLLDYVRPYWWAFALAVVGMRAQTLRTDATADHVAACTAKLARLDAQRRDLARCLDTLLARAADGRAFWRIYRQFKMYNDPTLNPYLYRDTDR